MSLVASCPADDNFLAASIIADVEIISKSKANLEFIPYTDGIVAIWDPTEAVAKKNELVIDKPSYSMFTYIETKLPPTAASLPIPDATFIKINDQRPSPSQLKYKLQNDSTSYLLELAYQEKPSDPETFLAVRVIKPSIIPDPTKSYSIKNADDLLKIRWNLAGTYDLSQDFALPTKRDDFYLEVDDYDTKGWVPVAKDLLAPFTGKLKGNGFAISNIKVANGAANGRSLLGYLNGAEVGNLKVTGTVQGDRNVGFVGWFGRKLEPTRH